MGELSDSSGASDFDEVERGFFASAPPEVAVPPPPPPSFDDLEELSQVRPRATRATRSTRLRARRSAKPSTDVATTPGHLALAARKLAGPVGHRLAIEAARAWRWTSARARHEAGRLSPRARLARERLLGGLQAFVARVAHDLPERPDGKSMAAAVAALVIVFGLSASVLGSRSNPRLTMVMEPLVVIGATPAPAEPAVAPTPEPVVAAEPVVVVNHRHAKRHVAAQTRKVAVAPARKIAGSPARKAAVSPLLMKPAFMR